MQPRKSRYGGIFRNHEGQPLLYFFGSIGWDTNNFAKLEGLWQGMKLADQHNFYPILIEGDTQILINMATQIQQGRSSSRVFNSWRLMTRLETIEKWIKHKKEISFIHVKRDYNKVADILENIGTHQDQIQHYGPLGIIDNQNQIQIYTDLMQQEAHSLDGGSSFERPTMQVAIAMVIGD